MDWWNAGSVRRVGTPAACGALEPAACGALERRQLAGMRAKPEKPPAAQNHNGLPTLPRRCRQVAGVPPRRKLPAFFCARAAPVQSFRYPNSL